MKKFFILLLTGLLASNVLFAQDSLFFHPKSNIADAEIWTALIQEARDSNCTLQIEIYGCYRGNLTANKNLAQKRAEDAQIFFNSLDSLTVNVISVGTLKRNAKDTKIVYTFVKIPVADSDIDYGFLSPLIRAFKNNPDPTITAFILIVFIVVIVWVTKSTSSSKKNSEVSEEQSITVTQPQYHQPSPTPMKKVVEPKERLFKKFTEHVSYRTKTYLEIKEAKMAADKQKKITELKAQELSAKRAELEFTLDINSVKEAIEIQPVKKMVTNYNFNLKLWPTKEEGALDLCNNKEDLDEFGYCPYCIEQEKAKGYQGLELVNRVNTHLAPVKLGNYMKHLGNAHQVHLKKDFVNEYKASQN